MGSKSEADCREFLQKSPHFGLTPSRGSPPGFRWGDWLAQLAAAQRGGFAGKVVLVDFWTYTCINWLRTLAYVRGWAEKYEDQGLVVVGVHTPEFPFERDIDNVRQVVKEMAIRYQILAGRLHR